MKLLMIEERSAIAEMMKAFFKKEKWDADIINDGKVALELFANNPHTFNMIILDLDLPRISGMEVGMQLRQISQQIPVILISSRFSDDDHVFGLEMGASDIIVKPFSPLTLINRMKAIYRRANSVEYLQSQRQVQEAEFDIQTNFFKLNSATREVRINNQALYDLTPKEFDLLSTLAQNPKRVFSRDQLLQIVWNYEYYGDERTVDAHIKKLRKKIQPFGKNAIQTVWGVGYKFDDSLQ
ncbi:response regulator transcription factor [Periweissella beninensis]|uniref:response regulator transcription factor n=1 Tax=Periweissella beninensis TaxID=504936 RepID=UPI0021A72EF0|nr:response regulator transcription factor [Periweissella beninensis]MCT4395632.1 DNA-binding response regulator [Periweissella beninensis]